MGLCIKISVPFLLSLLFQSYSCWSYLPHILPSAASYPDMNFSALDFIGLWHFHPFLLTVSFQSPISSDWILPLSIRCSFQLDLGHQAMNIFGNWGFHRSKDSQSSVAFCSLSLLQSLIPYEAWRCDCTHWYETIMSLYCLPAFSMGLWFCYLFVCFFLN